MGQICELNHKSHFRIVFNYLKIILLQGFPGGTSGKESACQCRRHKRSGFDSWVWKIPWRRACNLFQYSCLENPMDKGAWQATVHGAAESDITEVT